jgi:hypothetical protein
MLSETAPYVIGQSAFDPLAQLWKNYLTIPEALQQSFLQDNKVIQGVGFKMKHIHELVSTTGATHIKASFIIRPDKHGNMHFSVTLHAVDFLGTRLSSYYLPTYATTEHDLPVEAKGGTKKRYKNQLSNSLVNNWLTNWSDYGKGDAAYFASPYGPLLAYTFEVSEFVAMFFRLHSQRVNSSWLELSFVLHAYWRSMPIEAPTHEEKVSTFGLVIRLKRPTPDDPNDLPGGGTGDDAILDMGKPSPPY